jgi:hypothetical protein
MIETLRLRLPGLLVRFAGRFSRKRAGAAPTPVPDVWRSVARALDGRDADTAFALLGGVLPDPSDDRQVRLYLTLWRHALSIRFSDMPVSFDLATAWLDLVQRALEGGDPWPVLRDFDRTGAEIGRHAAARILVGVLRARMAKADAGLKSMALVLALDAGETDAAEMLLTYLLAADRDFVPGAWQVHALMRLWNLREETAVVDRMEGLLERAGRTELRALWSILRRLIRQRDAAGAMDEARALTDPAQCAVLADYLTGAAQHPDTMAHAVGIHDALAPPDAVPERHLMQARLAVAQGDWTKAMALTEKLLDHPELNLPAVCLRAMALGMTDDHDNAAAAVRHVRHSAGAPWFLRGRAALISVSLAAARDGAKSPLTLAGPSLQPGSGRPLAQSLWVGPRLRWIEQMSMQSFLLNGWRYKLYVYDEPEGVPEGVELADASAILPRDAIFIEGQGSGAHRGSLGAFSDLFRYALLVRRGGFWTDTDVINLDLFEPEGARLVASEWTDAGLIGPNGAQMAAPPDDPLQRTALAAAEELRAGNDMHFAQIGPELLAQLLAAGGHKDYDLMPPDFLNPIGWMQTGQLLAPFDTMRRAPCLSAARNIHVYTETWRLIGLGLDTPPPAQSFLGTLRARLAEATAPRPDLVRTLLAMS